MSNYVREIEINGFTIFRQVLAVEMIELLTATLGNLPKRQGGIRNLLKRFPQIQNLAQSILIKNLVAPILGNNSFPVRAIFFDKVPQSNWSVAWHQDLTIAVKQREDIKGFSGWSLKEGIVHVHPPIDILQQLLTVRIHLDKADENNGALQVIKGSHQLGKLSEVAIPSLLKTIDICTVDAGDVVVMRPLLLHASSKAKMPTHRRVIHIEFANQALPAPLEWFEF